MTTSSKTHSVLLSKAVYNNTLSAIEEMRDIYETNGQIANVAHCEQLYENLTQKATFDIERKRVYIHLSQQEWALLISRVYDRYLPPASDADQKRYDCIATLHTIKKQPTN